MTEISELTQTLQAHLESGTVGKIYFVAKQSGSFLNGSITVYQNGFSSVSYIKMPVAQAIEAMRDLRFEKFISLPTDETATPPDTSDPFCIRTSTLIEQLLQTNSATVLQASATKSLDSSGAMYLVQTSRSILEKYYGSGATKKVDEISLKYPPIAQPKAFLDECKVQCAAMAGAEKTDRVFKPLYEKIAAN